MYFFELRYRQRHHIMHMRSPLQMHIHIHPIYMGISSRQILRLMKPPHVPRYCRTHCLPLNPRECEHTRQVRDLEPSTIKEHNQLNYGQFARAACSLSVFFRKLHVLCLHHFKVSFGNKPLQLTASFASTCFTATNSYCKMWQTTVIQFIDEGYMLTKKLWHVVK